MFVDFVYFFVFSWLEKTTIRKIGSFRTHLYFFIHIPTYNNIYVLTSNSNTNRYVWYTPFT